MNKFIFLSVFIIISFSALCYSQGDFRIGVYAGGGVISSNSPSIGSFTTSLFIEADPNIYENITTRLSFLYAADVNSLVPGNRSTYHPFVKGASLKAIYAQYMSNTIYIEQGLGALILNDRTFSDINDWKYGLTFSLLAGIDLRQPTEYNGFRIGAGVEYGITISTISARIFSMHVQVQYIL